MKNIAWRWEALCAEISTELFFPDAANMARYAKQICSRCPVKSDCLEYALDNVDIREGIFGGMTNQERVRERARRRNLEAA